MAYNQNIPQPTDQLSVSQGDLLANFQAINTWVQVNHVGFNTANQGKHTFIAMPQQTGGTPFLAGEAGIYNFNFPKTSTLEIWFSMPSAAPPASVSFQYPITNCILSINSAPTLGTFAWQYGPGGVLEKWGLYSIGAAGAISIAVNGGAASFGPNFTTVLAMFITPYLSATASTAYVSAVGLPNVTVQSPGGQFFWRVIGV